MITDAKQLEKNSASVFTREKPRLRTSVNREVKSKDEVPSSIAKLIFDSAYCNAKMNAYSENIRQRIPEKEVIVDNFVELWKEQQKTIILAWSLEYDGYVFCLRWERMDSKLKSNKVGESSDIFKKVIASLQLIIEATTLRFTPETNFSGTGPVKEDMDSYNRKVESQYNVRERKHRQAWLDKNHGRMEGYQSLSTHNDHAHYMSRQYSNFPDVKKAFKLDRLDTPYRLTEKEWLEHSQWVKEDDSKKYLQTQLPRRTGLAAIRIN
ncbi:hypothetical protein BPAE_0087g00360 [Botrytis paeoniae]|uniref:Uncharacterized protein n=1 Tax=Botrytis paeoniae TaxID=278948 RepID=A0A4Z1FQ79_9HELO|nr:hypothetical protein BPAE_0087g00360 [Botrytis paeoniae]